MTVVHTYNIESQNEESSQSAFLELELCMEFTLNYGDLKCFIHKEFFFATKYIFREEVR